MLHKLACNHGLLLSNPLSVTLWRLIFITEDIDLNVFTQRQLIAKGQYVPVHQLFSGNCQFVNFCFH